MLMQSSAHRVEQFFHEDVSQLTAELQAIEEAVASRKTPRHDPEYDRLRHAITNSCGACEDIEQAIGDDRELLAEARSRFRKEIAPWFLKSPLMRHATTKPRGYPGDFEMLISIYERQPSSPGIGGYLDLYFLDSELGMGVPARMQCVTEFLKQQLARHDGDLSILDVACGPCEEFARNRIPLDSGDRDIQVTFLDYDKGALAHVKEKVISPRPDRDHFRCVHYNALRMRSADRFIKQFGKFDIIYSVGLCDYIENRLLIPMLRGWRETTNENGVVFVAFKDQALYDKHRYQWHVDWHFLQRSQQDCLDILEEAGFDTRQVEVTRDATGVIMNFMAPVAASRQHRIDRAHQHLPAPASRSGQASEYRSGQGEASVSKVDA